MNPAPFKKYILFLIGAGAMNRKEGAG